VVYNWGEAPSQPVDLSSVLSVGDAFEIRNAQDYFGPPVVTGTFQGSPVSIPQLGLAPVQPVGTPGSYDPADQTGSLFNAFVVRKLASACSSAVSCNDDNPCTTDDCQQGVCVNTPAAGCCQSAVQCDDGDPCTADSCSDHACQHSTVTGCCKDASQCDDGSACTEDSCSSDAAGPQASSEGSSDGGCGCSTPSRRSPSPLLAALVAVVWAGLHRRRLA